MSWIYYALWITQLVSAIVSKMDNVELAIKFDPESGHVAMNESLTIRMRIFPKMLPDYVILKFGESEKRIGFMHGSKRKSDFFDDENVEITFMDESNSTDYQDLITFRIKRMDRSYSDKITATAIAKITLEANAEAVLLEDPREPIKANAELINSLLSVENEILEFSQDDQIRLTCSGQGGNPMPRVGWYMQRSDGLIKPLELTSVREERFFKKFENFTFTDTLTNWSHEHDKAKVFCRIFPSTREAGAGYLNSNFIPIRVKYRPIFIYDQDKESPGNHLNDSLEIKIAESARLDYNCEILSNPRGSVRWIRKSDNFVVSKYPRLLIQSVSRKDYGHYECVAENALGSASLFHLVQVYYHPTITITQYRQIVEGATINETCHVTSYPPARSVRWKRPKESMPDRNQTLIIPQTTRYDKGQYSCIVTADIGIPEDVIFDSYRDRSLWLEQTHFSKSMEIQILHPPGKPKIEMRNGNSIHVGESIILNCLVEDKIDLGNPYSNFIWSFKPHISGESKVLTISPAQFTDALNMNHVKMSQNYTITKSTIYDSGQYSCRLNNTEGEGPLTSVHITVESGPIMIASDEHSDSIVISGSSIDEKTSISIPTFHVEQLRNLTCRAESNPRSEFIWFRNQQRITSENSPLLSVLSMDREQPFQSESRLVFKEPLEGCNSICDPTVRRIKWILNMEKSEYVCVAKNSKGRDQTKFIFQPNFGVIPLSTVQRTFFYDSKSRGQRIGPFLCDFTGSKMTKNFRWYKKTENKWQEINFSSEKNKFQMQFLLERPIHNALIDYINQSHEFIDRNTTQILLYLKSLYHSSTALWIENFQPSDPLEYKCEALDERNNFLAKDSVFLTETSLPGPIHDARQIDSTETSITIKWLPGEHGLTNVNNQMITSGTNEVLTFSHYVNTLTNMIFQRQDYEIGIFEYDSKEMERIFKVISHNYVNITDLYPGVNYQIILTPRNSMGKSNNAVQISGLTKNAQVVKPSDVFFDKESQLIDIPPGNSGLCVKLEVFDKDTWKQVVIDLETVLSAPSIETTQTNVVKTISYKRFMSLTEEKRANEQCLPLQESSIQRIRVASKESNYRIRYCNRKRTNDCSIYVNIKTGLSSTLIFIVGVTCISCIFLIFLILLACYLRRTYEHPMACCFMKNNKKDKKAYKNMIIRPDNLLKSPMMTGVDSLYQSYPQVDRYMGTSQQQAYFVMCPPEKETSFHHADPVDYDARFGQNRFEMSSVNYNLHNESNMTPVLFANGTPQYSTCTLNKSNRNIQDTFANENMMNSYTMKNWMSPNDSLCENGQLHCDPILDFANNNGGHGYCSSTFIENPSSIVHGSPQSYPIAFNATQTLMRKNSCQDHQFIAATRTCV